MQYDCDVSLTIEHRGTPSTHSTLQTNFQHPSAAHTYARRIAQQDHTPTPTRLRDTNTLSPSPAGSGTQPRITIRGDTVRVPGDPRAHASMHIQHTTGHTTLHCTALHCVAHPTHSSPTDNTPPHYTTLLNPTLHNTQYTTLPTQHIHLCITSPIRAAAYTPCPYPHTHTHTHTRLPAPSAARRLRYARRATRLRLLPAALPRLSALCPLLSGISRAVRSDTRPAARTPSAAGACVVRVRVCALCVRVVCALFSRAAPALFRGPSRAVCAVCAASALPLRCGARYSGRCRGTRRCVCAASVASGVRFAVRLLALRLAGRLAAGPLASVLVSGAAIYTAAPGSGVCWVSAIFTAVLQLCSSTAPDTPPHTHTTDADSRKEPLWPP